ncbi:sporulation and spore germination protein [Kribbella sp. VKM Ac-2527]|uniref:Sporulation and spore germination protein n=1 Tax=Kribbella caucasensis TaxID=2512215 RepID=A0A4R6J3C7_9ACTN|nr:GerMN domain-containing protein [Kribbella sp. VKM Ac-2527]TDO29840.1 sporulation and spore germination protein [Kribbella sp. VKM Ac-2527]
MRKTVCVISFLMLLVGCGVPVQQEPAPIQPEAIPSHLRGTGAPTIPQPTATPGSPTLQVHFVRNDRLFALAREAPTTTPADRLAAVIQALMTGPNDTEQSDGITSALPPELTLTVADVQGKRVVLELSGETEGRSAAENVLAVGQIVLSVTALPTVDEVTFQRHGVAVEALLADGALTTEPLTAADYAALRSS